MLQKNPREDGEYLNALARGLAVLRAFGRGKPGMTLSEIAACTELNPAVVRRCLNTLVHLGYVGKKDKLFLLRPEVFSLGSAYIESMNLEEVVVQHLQPIRDLTGNSTAMAVLSGQEALFMVYNSTKLLARIVAGVGTRFPAYATAAGRALLAWLDKPRLNAYFASLHPIALTDRTITSKAKLKQILAEVKKQGYAAIESELDYGVASVAVPVFSEDGRVVAALSCSTSPARQTLANMVEEALPLLRQAAHDIEIELRRSPMLVYSIIN
ncbi:MAG: helix-turn-helix domain-containing protein [Pseudomonadales bacterium]|jgi:IclR family pca regulon transcriptional regulator|nr:helix-turn-helix domain-containing protein [Pseudomonadales bacterium]